MLQHMLAAIDEQIFACKEELSVLTGKEWICSRVRSSRTVTLDLEAIYQTLESYVNDWELLYERFKEIEITNRSSQRLMRAELLYDTKKFIQQLEYLKGDANTGSKAYIELLTKGGTAINKSIMDEWDSVLNEIKEYIEIVNTNISQLSTYYNYDVIDFIHDMGFIREELDKRPALLEKCKTGSWIPFKSKLQSIAEALKFADGVEKELALLRQDTESGFKKINDEIDSLNRRGLSYKSKTPIYSQWTDALTSIETAENEIKQYRSDVIALEKN
jgi:hypothetical protein